MEYTKIFKGLMIAVVIGGCLEVFAKSDELVTPIDKHLHNNTFISPLFTKDGKPMLTFTEFNSKAGAATVQIADASISPVANITVDANPNTISSVKKGTMYQKMYWDKIERDTLFDIKGLGYYTEEVKNRLNKLFGKYDSIGKYITESGTSDGEVFGNLDSSYETLPTGEKVIKYFVYYNNNYTWVLVKCTGSCRIEKQFEGKTSEPIYTYSPLISYGLLNYDSGASPIAKISVTQTLFNDDESFEYVAPIYKSEVQENENIIVGYVCDFKDCFAFEGTYSYVQRPGDCLGFSIVNDKGTVLQTVNFEEGFKAISEDFMTVIVIGGKTYLNCNLSSEKGDYSVIYEINKHNSNVRSVGTFKISVSPTVVSRGENINVNFGDSSEEEFNISVTDVAGRTFYRNTLSSSERRTAIPTDNLSSGLNIVTLDGEHSGHHATKVIVK